MNCVPMFDFKMPDLKRPLELLVWCGTRTSQKPHGNEVLLLDFLMFSRVDMGYFSVPYLSRFSRFALTLIKKISATYLGDVGQLGRLDFKSEKRRKKENKWRSTAKTGKSWGALFKEIRSVCPCGCVGRLRSTKASVFLSNYFAHSKLSSFV